MYIGSCPEQTGREEEKMELCGVKGKKKGRERKSEEVVFFECESLLSRCIEGRGGEG